MVAVLFSADSIAAVFKGVTFDPDPALLGTIIAHPWLVLATLQLFAKLEVSSFIRSKFQIYAGGPKI